MLYQLNTIRFELNKNKSIMELQQELFELAEKQYEDLKKEMNTGNIKGAESEEVVIFKNKEYKIKILGFWEKQNWFEFNITCDDFKYSGDYCY